MKRQGSKLAYNIDREYKREQAYKRRNRQKCKETECNNCRYEQICENKEIKENQ